MTDLDRNLHKLLRQEADDTLFVRMELSEQVKRKIRQQAAAEKAERRFVLPKTWAMGAAALAAAIMIVAGLPMLEQPAVPVPAGDPVESLPPSNQQDVGSDLSSLIATPLNSAEEAKEAFGPSLLIPSVAPEGFTLSEINAVGMEGKPVRDVIFTYVSGDKTFTFAASRNPASFPVDLFTPKQVNGEDGFIFEQEGFTELFWAEGDIQYSISGQLSGDEAMKVAASVKP